MHVESWTIDNIWYKEKILLWCLLRKSFTEANKRYAPSHNSTIDNVQVDLNALKLLKTKNLGNPKPWLMIYGWKKLYYGKSD